MSEVQRKIELQSPEDLRYLINNAQRAASEKIERAFPPMANQGEDAMKIRVQELVDEYIHQTFSTASPNISINGYAATLPSDMFLTKDDKDGTAAKPILSSSIEEYEPLNTKLQVRALELARKEEDLLIEIAGLRREAPGKAVEGFRKVWREGVEGDEERVRRVEEGVLERGMKKRKRKRGGEGEGEGGDLNLDLGKELGFDVGGTEVQETWRRGVGDLERLRDELPATAARLEKARKAGEFVRSSK